MANEQSCQGSWVWRSTTCWWREDRGNLRRGKRRKIHKKDKERVWGTFGKEGEKRLRQGQREDRGTFGVVKIKKKTKKGHGNLWRGEETKKREKSKSGQRNL